VFRFESRFLYIFFRDPCEDSILERIFLFPILKLIVTHELTLHGALCSLKCWQLFSWSRYFLCSGRPVTGLLSWATWIHSTPSRVILLYISGSPKWSHPMKVSSKNSVCSTHFPLRATCPTISSSFTWLLSERRTWSSFLCIFLYSLLVFWVQIFSSALCFRYSQSVALPSSERPSLTSITIHDHPFSFILPLKSSWNWILILKIVNYFVSTAATSNERYEGVSKSFRTGLLEWEPQMVQLSATRCSCIVILWVSLVSFGAIILGVASQRVFIVISLSTQSGNFWIDPRTLN
jgi:hypothetical protein